MTKVLLIGADMQPEHTLLSQEQTIDCQLAVSDDMDILLAQVDQLQPHIVVISDQGSPDTADELCLLISFAHRDCKVLIISDTQPDLTRLQKSGFKCRGYISEKQRASIVKAVTVVHAGEAWLPRKLVADLLDQLAGDTNVMASFLQLVKS